MARRRAPKWLQARRADPARSPVARPDWLARALGRAGVLPTTEAEHAIRAGRVSLRGSIVREPLALVSLGDEVRLDGRTVSLAFRTRVLALHKPAGVVTAKDDPEGLGTVFEVLGRALPAPLQSFGWHAVGRLDRDTTGLLLFTNDERFVEHATAPTTHLPKRYLATVQGAVEEAKLAPLREGVPLHDGPARPALAHVRGPSQVELTITEGRNHQVKRMLGAVGLPVLRLHREAVGTFELDVAEGAVRELSDAEVRERLGFAPRGAPAAGDQESA